MQQRRELYEEVYQEVLGDCESRAMESSSGMDAAGTGSRNSGSSNGGRAAAAAAANAALAPGGSLDLLQREAEMVSV